jgi:hypothetical protein
MGLISKETLLIHLQRAEMASDVKLPIEFFRDLVYQAMPRPWVGLANEDRLCAKYMQDAPEGIEAVIDYISAKLKEQNNG